MITSDEKRNDFFYNLHLEYWDIWLSRHLKKMDSVCVCGLLSFSLELMSQ